MSTLPSRGCAVLRATALRLLALLPALIFMTAAAELSSPGDERALAAPLASSSLLLDGDAIGDHMVVVGERGHILVSRDAGVSWAQADVPTRATLTGVTLHDLTRGWAVGHDAVILRTRDGGLSWEIVYAAPEEERPLLDVWFEDAEHGFAVGAYGYFLETRDGGDTWGSRRISDGDHHLNRIAAGPAGRLYIAAESGRAFRSDDGGQSWEVLATPYSGSFFGALPLADKQVYLYGLRGHLYRSDDAGASWSPITTRTESMLTDGIKLDGDGLLFTGMGGTLLVGDADSLFVSPYQRADRQGIAGVLNAGDGDLVIFGEFGVERTRRDLLEPLQ